MAASDLPEEAVEAALYGKLRPIVDAHLDHFEAVTRADERAQVLAEVDAALRALAEHLLERDPMGVDFGDLVDGIRHAADHLRDTLGTGGEG